MSECVKGAGTDGQGRYWIMCLHDAVPGSNLCVDHTAERFGRQSHNRRTKAKRKRQKQARKANR